MTVMLGDHDLIYQNDNKKSGTNSDSNLSLTTAQEELVPELRKEDTSTKHNKNVVLKEEVLLPPRMVTVYVDIDFNLIEMMIVLDKQKTTNINWFSSSRKPDDPYILEAIPDYMRWPQIII